MKNIEIDFLWISLLKRNETIYIWCRFLVKEQIKCSWIYLFRYSSLSEKQKLSSMERYMQIIRVKGENILNIYSLNNRSSCTNILFSFLFLYKHLAGFHRLEIQTRIYKRKARKKETITLQSTGGCYLWRMNCYCQSRINKTTTTNSRIRFERKTNYRRNKENNFF